MLTLHQGPTGDLLSGIIGSSDEPVILISPVLPSQTVMDQVVISTRQAARELKLVTSLYGLDPTATARQINGLLKLNEMGINIKIAPRGSIPSILVAPPSGCLLLPHEWGLTSEKWNPPLIVPGKFAGSIFELASSIWSGSGASAGRRLLLTNKRWLEEVASEGHCSDPNSSAQPGEIEFSELTLFDKRRGGGRKKSKRVTNAWWTFHGTAGDRLNPFQPVRSWALRKDTHRFIRFPLGRRPTGVKTGDDIFFVVNSRLPGGNLGSFIIGHATAVAYRPLVDDATDDERANDEYLARFPHAIRLECVRFIRGAVGEGIPAHKLMSRLGASTFESTQKNRKSGKGNIDPFKSTNQKSILKLSDKCADETSRLLEERLTVIGNTTASEISRS